MENVPVKVSFGFKKTTDKPNLLKNHTDNANEKKIELIDSIEGSDLKIIGKDLKDEECKKLVIPMTNEQKTRPISKLMESRNARKRKQDDKEPPNDKISTVENETLEQKAAREIMEDLQKAATSNESKILELPIHPDELPLNGAVESSIDDYERIPIADFGKAMLRGMGWKEQQEKEDKFKFDVPIVRPKGLGLGADKVVKKQKLLVQPAPNETLEIKKNACIKVLAGKHKNLYGTIEGFDDGGGRLVIKLAIGGLKVLMNEFMVQPIPKQEFAKYSKILNSEKYEEYKKDDNSQRKSRSLSPKTSRGENRSRKSIEESSKCREDSSSKGKDGNEPKVRNKSPTRNRSRTYEKLSDHRKKDTRRYSSDSEDDKTCNRKYNERHRSRSHERHRKRHSSSDSSSERHRSKKKSSKKSSKSKSKKQESSDRYYSSDDEKKHKKKYKRSKHHRDRS